MDEGANTLYRGSFFSVLRKIILIPVLYFDYSKYGSVPLCAGNEWYVRFWDKDLKQQVSQEGKKIFQCNPECFQRPGYLRFDSFKGDMECVCDLLILFTIHPA